MNTLVIKNPYHGGAVKITVRYMPMFTVLSCTVGKLPFHGKLIIKYAPEEYLLEFEAFDQWLKSELATATMTIEDVAYTVAARLSQELQATVSVWVYAQTTVHAPAMAFAEAPFVP